MPEPLHNRRVLVVEDENLLMHELAVRLEDEGAVVLGPFASADSAREFLERKQHVDVAILDLNLNGEPADAVADALQARGIPFVITSGYDTDSSEARYRGVPHFGKPVDFGALFEALAATSNERRAVASLISSRGDKNPQIAEGFERGLQAG